MFKKILKGLKKVAPIAAGVASVTGVLPPGIAKALNLGADASEDDIEAAVVKADPSQLAELRRVEADLQVNLAKNDVELYKAEAADRDSARKREIALKDKTPAILAFTTIGGFIALIMVLCFKGVPEASEATLYVLAGLLGAAVNQVLGYFFGTSSSSKSKDEVVHDIARSGRGS